MFCPGIGIAVDSCAELIVLFERPCVGSALAAFVGDNTESADGTDGSTTDPSAGRDSVGTGLSTIGVGGGVGVWSQATSHSMHAQSVITADDGFMQFPGWWSRILA